MRGPGALAAWLAAAWLLLTAWGRGARGPGAAAMLVCSNTTFCDVIRCTYVDAESCRGEVRENATVCGCCPACIEIYDVGASCPGYNGRQRPGTKNTWECASGSECINNQCTIVGTTTETMQT